MVIKLSKCITIIALSIQTRQIYGALFLTKIRTYLLLRLIFAFFLFFFFCFSFSEHFKLFRSDGYEVFNQEGCNSSYPAGTSLEVPFGDAEHLTLDVSLEYRWSVVNVEYSIVGQTLDSGLQPMAYHTYILA